MKKSTILAIVLLFILLGINYVNSNLDKIYISKAENAYKKNDISTAQSYMEKAFALGVNDFRQREIYVNSIINAPFDSTAQEKLIKFLEINEEDVAKICAESFLETFKQEILKNYTYNYIKQAPFNQKVVRWANVPISYGFQNCSNVPNYFMDEFETAFVEWEEVTNHQLIFMRNDNNPQIVIKFDEINPADNKTQKYIAAYTVPIVETDLLKHMQINFYTKDPGGEYQSPNQVYNTALHEISHALGVMGHSDDKDDVMYLSKGAETISKDTRLNLTEGDINTIKLLYKIKPDISNIHNADGDYIPELILGNDEEINSSKIKEAKTYIKKAPGVANGYIDLANTYVANKEYAKAIKLLDKALDRADTDEVKSIVCNNLAICYFYLEGYDLAQDYIEQSIKIKPSNEKYYLLTEIYHKKGQIQKAIKGFETLISQNPKNIEYTLALANIYVEKKKYMSARRVLKNYILKNPESKNNPRFKSYGFIAMFL